MQPHYFVGYTKHCNLNLGQDHTILIQPKKNALQVKNFATLFSDQIQ